MAGQFSLSLAHWDAAVWCLFQGGPLILMDLFVWVEVRLNGEGAGAHLSPACVITVLTAAVTASGAGITHGRMGVPFCTVGFGLKPLQLVMVILTGSCKVTLKVKSLIGIESF